MTYKDVISGRKVFKLTPLNKKELDQFELDEYFGDYEKDKNFFYI